MAVEIPLKYKYRCVKAGKTNASRTSNNGPARHRGETDKNRLAVAQSVTAANRMVLHLTASGKLRWERAEI